MKSALTPQPDPTQWADDPAIEDGDELLRVCKTGLQISRNHTGKYVLSDQIFSANGPGCSVELLPLITEAGAKVEDRVQQHGAVGAVLIKAGDVRGVPIRGDVKLSGNLGVVYTPIAADEPNGPNPFHADIFPKTTSSANKRLTKVARPIAEIDQVLGERLYRKARGLDPEE